MIPSTCDEHNSNHDTQKKLVGETSCRQAFRARSCNTNCRSQARIWITSDRHKPPLQVRAIAASLDRLDRNASTPPIRIRSWQSYWRLEGCTNGTRYDDAIRASRIAMTWQQMPWPRHSHARHEWLFRVRFAQSGVAQLGLAPTLAGFASGSVIPMQRSSREVISPARRSPVFVERSGYEPLMSNVMR